MNAPALALPVILALSLSNAFAFADTTITDFESGIPSGWTTTGTAWTVGGTASTAHPISAPEGTQFARSGAPAVYSGALNEALTGSLTSSALTVTYSSLQWQATGWSGDPYFYGSGTNGLNRFEILDDHLNVKAIIAAPQSDGWATDSVNLLNIGLSAGSTFYFRAIDGSSASSFSWLAFDNLHFTGQALQISTVPEPETLALALSGIAVCGLRARRNKGHA